MWACGIEWARGALAAKRRLNIAQGEALGKIDKERSALKARLNARHGCILKRQNHDASDISYAPSALDRGDVTYLALRARPFRAATSRLTNGFRNYVDRPFANSLTRRYAAFRLLTFKKRSLRLANLQLLLHYSDSEVRC